MKSIAIWLSSLFTTTDPCSSCITADVVSFYKLSLIGGVTSTPRLGAGLCLQPVKGILAVPTQDFGLGQERLQ